MKFAINTCDGYENISPKTREKLQQLLLLSFPGSKSNDNLDGWIYWIEYANGKDNTHNDKDSKNKNNISGNKNTYKDNKNSINTVIHRYYIDLKFEETKFTKLEETKSIKLEETKSIKLEETKSINPNSDLYDSPLAILNIGYESELLLFTIQNFCVHPKFRGRGLGTALVTHAMKNWNKKDESFNFISLWVDNENKKAIKLYQRLGFFRVDKRQVEILKNAAKKFYGECKSEVNGDKDKSENDIDNQTLMQYHF